MRVLIRLVVLHATVAALVGHCAAAVSKVGGVVRLDAARVYVEFLHKSPFLLIDWGSATWYL